MAEYKSVGTPMEVDVKLSTKDSSPLVDEEKYIRPDTVLETRWGTAHLPFLGDRPSQFCHT